MLTRLPDVNGHRCFTQTQPIQFGLAGVPDDGWQHHDMITDANAKGYIHICAQCGKETLYGLIVLVPFFCSTACELAYQDLEEDYTEGLALTALTLVQSLTAYWRYKSEGDTTYLQCAQDLDTLIVWAKNIIEKGVLGTGVMEDLPLDELLKDG